MTMSKFSATTPDFWVILTFLVDRVCRDGYPNAGESDPVFALSNALRYLGLHCELHKGTAHPSCDAPPYIKPLKALLGTITAQLSAMFGYGCDKFGSLSGRQEKRSYTKFKEFRRADSTVICACTTVSSVIITRTGNLSYLDYTVDADGRIPTSFGKEPIVNKINIREIKGNRALLFCWNRLVFLAKN